MNRRELTQALAALGVGEMLIAAEPEVHLLKRNGWVPNNERLPLLLYRGLFGAGVRDMAAAFEALMQKNGWVPEWRNGVYPFHHYHSTAHEVLGFARGEAQLLLGGELPRGLAVKVKAGDLAVLPCGTGHCRVSASADFLVVGGYPLQQRWDLCREAPDAAMLQRMKVLPTPRLDPVGRVWK